MRFNQVNFYKPSEVFGVLTTQYVRNFQGPMALLWRVDILRPPTEVPTLHEGSSRASCSQRFANRCTWSSGQYIRTQTTRGQQAKREGVEHLESLQPIILFTNVQMYVQMCLYGIKYRIDAYICIYIYIYVRTTSYHARGLAREVGVSLEWLETNQSTRWFKLQSTRQFSTKN